MTDFWNTVVQAGLTVGMPAFFARRLERFKGAQSKDLERIKTDQMQYFERLRADQAKELEALKSELSVIARLQAQAVERRAGIAAQVLISTLRYLDALKAATSVAFQAQTQPGGSESDVLRADFNARWEGIQEREADFTDALVLAEVHLPEGVNGILAEVWTLRREIRANQSTHVAMLVNSKGGYHDSRFFEKSFGSEPQKKIDQLRDASRTKLRALVSLQLEQVAELASAPVEIAQPEHP